MASLWRGRQSGLLSTATIGVALFVLGAFLLVTSNLDRVATDWSRSAEISVYLDEAATPADRNDIERLLAPGSTVASFEFISKDAALKRFKEMFTDLSETIDTVEGNPLPESRGAAPVVGRRRDRGGHSSSAARARGQRRPLRPAWLDRLLSAVNFIRIVGLALRSYNGGGRADGGERRAPGVCTRRRAGLCTSSGPDRACAVRSSSKSASGAASAGAYGPCGAVSDPQRLLLAPRGDDGHLVDQILSPGLCGWSCWVCSSGGGRGRRGARPGVKISI